MAVVLFLHDFHVSETRFVGEGYRHFDTSGMCRPHDLVTFVTTFSIDMYVV